MLFVWISIPFVCKGSGTCGTEVMQNLFDIYIYIYIYSSIELGTMYIHMEQDMMIYCTTLNCKINNIVEYYIRLGIN